MRLKPAIIRGWDVPKEDYTTAHQRDGLVKLLIELSNVCNLSCAGCFTKRVDGGWNGKTKKRLSNELPYEHQVELLGEAARLGVKTVDIVGAGEPTLDPRFNEIIDRINDFGMYAVVFTHGVSKEFEHMDAWKKRDVSFFVKLWSRNHALQDQYVSGSLPDYSKRRDETIERMLDAGLVQGNEVVVDGINYRTTRIGADVLVMNSNVGEVEDILRYCRERNIMPIIKTYIPEGPTRFAQSENLRIYREDQLAELKRDEVSLADFAELRRRLVRLDQDEFGIPEMRTLYPQAVKCTQSMASMYVTITGDIKSCVGTHLSYGKYEAGKGMLAKAIRERTEKVGFGCVPRLEDAKIRGLPIAQNLKDIYSEGMR